MSNKFRNKHNQSSASVYAFYNITDLVQEQWPRLTAIEANSYKTEFSKFCEVVQREYGIALEEIERCLELMKRETLYAA